jgi:membrane dipeptidase
MTLKDAHVSRRALLQRAGACSALAIGAPMINLGRAHAAASDGPMYSTRAIDLVHESLVIDMLAPLTLNPQTADRWITSSEGLSAEEIAKFKSSGINAFHHSPGITGPGAYAETVLFMARYNALIARTSDLFARMDRVSDFAHIKSQGRVGVLLGVQNCEHLRSVQDVDFFHGLGLRCVQLTYNEQNLLGAGSTERVDGGITDFGAAIIEKLNGAGILIDVSHCGDHTTLDAIELSAKPVAVTHSNCRALNDHPRLKTDEAIRKLASKGGVMGISGVRMFVRDREPTTIEHMVDHIDHVVRLVGIEHVGIGSDADLDGYDRLPREQWDALRAAYKLAYRIRDKGDTDGFNHPRKMFDLTEALLRRGYSNKEVAAILGGNFLRLLQSTWTA